MVITELAILIPLILLTTFAVARIYGADGFFGIVRLRAFPKVTETKNKPIKLFYNNHLVDFRRGVAFKTKTNEAFNEPLKNVKIALNKNVPYELNVPFPYRSVKVVSNGNVLYRSKETLHPGEKFIVKKPFVVVTLYP